MIRRPPSFTLDRSSAASNVYKRQASAGAGSIVGSWCDYNRDGRLDLFVGTFAARGLPYRANAKGTFRGVGAACGKGRGLKRFAA